MVCQGPFPLQINRSLYLFYWFFSSRRRHTRLQGDWSSDVCSSDRGGACGPELHPAKRERNEGDDDQRIEDDGRQHRTLRAVQLHDVERSELRVGRDEQGRDDREVLRHVVRDREGRQRPTGDEQLLPDLDDL